MATIVDDSGIEHDVPDDVAGQLVQGGGYKLKGTVALSGEGTPVAVGAHEIGQEGTTLRSAAEAANRAASARFDAEHSDIISKGRAFAGGALHWANEALPATFARNWAADKLGIDNPFAEDIQAHPYLGHAVEAADAVGGLFIGGGEAKAAKAAFEVRGATEAPRVLTAAEKLAAAEDPLLIEHAASTLGSKAVFAGEATTPVETTLKRANGAIDSALAVGEKSRAIPEDLAGMGMKELQAAEKTETAAMQAAREAAKPRIAEDIISLRTEMKRDAKTFLATAGLRDSKIGAEAGKMPVQEIGKIGMEADAMLDRLLRDPKGLAKDPGLALKALRQQEHALEQLSTREGALRAAFAAEAPVAEAATEGVAAAANAAEEVPRMSWREFTAGKMGEYMKSEGGHGPAMARLSREWKDYQGGAKAVKAAKVPSGDRLRALDSVPQMLERNRAIQARIAEVKAPLDSPRLQSIRDAKELAAVGANEKPSFLQKMTEGAAYGKVHMAMGALGAAVGGPLGAVIGTAAPAVAAKVGKYVTEKLFGRMASEGLKAAGRATSAIDAFMSVAPKFTPAAKVLASEVLNNARFAPASDTKVAPGVQPLAQAYNARAAEIRSQVAPNARTGALELRPEARQAIADRIRALAGGSPLLADRIETLAARKIEYLANQLPRQPDLGGMPVGPSKWQPSEMQMREFARKVAAVEDPHGVVERLAAGTVTTEDRDAMKAVYPEMFNSILNQIMARLPTLRTSLPFQKRLAMSVFSGVAVDAACNPIALASLQSNFAAESGSADGSMPPKPQPQFGSVRSTEKPTAAQQRAAGETAV